MNNNHAANGYTQNLFDATEITGQTNNNHPQTNNALTSD